MLKKQRISMLKGRRKGEVEVVVPVLRLGVELEVVLNRQERLGFELILFTATI